MTHTPASALSALPPALLAVAAAVIGVNILAGGGYVWDCRRAGGNVNECWTQGLQIGGLGSGGTLALSFGVGALVGNKQGKEQGYQEGFWTLNPALRESGEPDRALQ